MEKPIAGEEIGFLIKTFKKFLIFQDSLFVKFPL